MRQLLRPALEVCALYGLLGWVYVAAVAAFRPDILAGPLTSYVPVRRDTFGACCFVISVAGSFALQLRYGLSGRRARRTGPVDAALRTVWFYALLIWVYLCVNSITHPWTIERPLTHFVDVPTEGTTASGAFLASAVALFVLRLRAHRSASVMRRD
jgi:hypothetical protein